MAVHEALGDGTSVALTTGAASAAAAGEARGPAMAKVRPAANAVRPAILRTCFMMPPLGACGAVVE